MQKYPWTYRWFGLWSEMGRRYANCPSIYDFIDPHWNPSDREPLLRYIEEAACYVATSKIGFPCVLFDDDCVGSYGFKTDGAWQWPTDLTHYVTVHGVSLPDEFAGHIRRRDYKIPELSVAELMALESTLDRPPLLISLPDEGNTGMLVRHRRATAPAELEKADEAFRAGDYSLAFSIYETTLPYLLVAEPHHVRQFEYCKRRLPGGAC